MVLPENYDISTDRLKGGYSASELRKRGTEDGIRTRVTLVESQMSYPIDDLSVVQETGFEPVKPLSVGVTARIRCPLGYSYVLVSEIYDS